MNSILKAKEKFKNKKALVMSLNYPSASPRPMRIIRFLDSKGFQVDLFSYPFDGEQNDKVSHHHVIERHKYDLLSKIIRNLHELTPVITRFPLGKKIKEFIIISRYLLNSYLKQLAQTEYDLIVIQEIFLLPVAFKIKGNAKTLFDAREYYPSQNEENHFFRMFEKPEREWLCEEYIPLCDELITVSPGLKERYDREFGVNFSILRSTPGYVDIEPVQLKNDQFKMVHHGGANRNRQLEKMIELTRKLDSRFSLDMYLVGEIGYIEELKKLISDTDRINIKEPVGFEQIVPTINQYDIGLFYIEPATFNLKHCLPNKLFEFIQARLMVAIGPSPDMAELVNKTGCGVVSEEFTIESMIETLSKLTSDEVWVYKQKSHQAATELCFEKEVEKLDQLVDYMMSEN